MIIRGDHFIRTHYGAELRFDGSIKCRYFEELIGIASNEEKNEFRAYAKLRAGAFVKTTLKVGGDSIKDLHLSNWDITDEAHILAASIECGDHWSWVHKKISPAENHDFMSRSISWAILKHLGKQYDEPDFRIKDNKAHNFILVSPGVRISYDDDIFYKSLPISGLTNEGETDD